MIDRKWDTKLLPEGRLLLTFWFLSRKLKEKFLSDLCGLSEAGGEHWTGNRLCVYRESPFDSLWKMKISDPDNAGNQGSHEIDGWPHAGRGGRWKNDLSEITIKADEYEIGS